MDTIDLKLLFDIKVQLAFVFVINGCQSFLNRLGSVLVSANHCFHVFEALIKLVLFSSLSLLLWADSNERSSFNGLEMSDCGKKS